MPKTVFQALMGSTSITPASLGQTLFKVSASFLVYLGFKSFLDGQNALEQQQMLEKRFQLYDANGQPDLHAMQDDILPDQDEYLTNSVDGAGHLYNLRTAPVQVFPNIAELASQAPGLVLLTLVSLFPNGVKFTTTDGATLTLQAASDALTKGGTIQAQLGTGSVVELSSFAQDDSGKSYLISMVARTGDQHIFSGMATWIVRVDKETGAVSCEWAGKGQSSNFYDTLNNAVAGHLFGTIFRAFPAALADIATRTQAERTTLTTETISSANQGRLAVTSNLKLWGSYRGIEFMEKLTILLKPDFIKEMNAAQQDSPVLSVVKQITDQFASDFMLMDGNDQAQVQQAVIEQQFDQNLQGTGVQQGNVQETGNNGGVDLTRGVDEGVQGGVNNQGDGVGGV